MLRCVVVDDESGAIEVLENYIRKTPQLTLDRSFRRSMEALNHLTHHPVDVVFLDIDMPELSGMQVAELIRDLNVTIVFCTAYSEFAVEGYDHDPADYLLKPVDYERFLKAVARVEKGGKRAAPRDGSGPPRGKLFIKSGSQIHCIDPDTLLFMKKDGHYIAFHTPSGTVLSRMNMDDLMALLPADNFARVHRSYVVALDKIDTIQKSSLQIRSKEIPIGESYRKDFLNRIDVSGN
jgi:two-component system LytT family response regulator